MIYLQYWHVKTKYTKQTIEQTHSALRQEQCTQVKPLATLLSLAGQKSFHLHLQRHRAPARNGDSAGVGRIGPLLLLLLLGLLTFLLVERQGVPRSVQPNLHIVKKEGLRIIGLRRMYGTQMGSRVYLENGHEALESCGPEQVQPRASFHLPHPVAPRHCGLSQSVV